MKVVGLFAGIGGVERGFIASGHEAVLLSEIWRPAQAVLRSHFPDVELDEDVTQLDHLPGSTDLVVAGFPCQDLSQAGLTAGIGGKRSGLVDHVFRLIDDKRVPWVVLENVSFILHLDKGQGLAKLVDAFEERGYRWAYRVVNSLGFVPQRRERIILVATTTDTNPADVLLVDDVPPVSKETSLFEHAHGFYWTEGVRGLGWAPDAIPTLKNGSTVGIASPPAILMPSGMIVTPDIRDAERLQGFPPDWTAPAEAVGRSSLRWSLVGNAVSVPVAQWLGERLAAPGKYDVTRDQPLTGSWPKSARFDGSQRWWVKVGAFPVWRDRPPLSQFLRYKGKPLSARATRGFLTRTDRSTLRFVPGFLSRVRNHLATMEGDTHVADWEHPAVAAE
jgi:DNA (cytosine-5)-methyltransferase 1